MSLKKHLYILFFLKIYIICLNQTDPSYINNRDITIKNAVYIIRTRDGDLNLEYKSSLIFVNERKKKLKRNFEIIKDTNEKEDYYYIKTKGLYLSSNNEKIDCAKKSFNQDKDSILWKIIPKINEDNKLIYYVQNKKNQKFWEILNKSNFKLSEETKISNLNEYNEFLFIELYKLLEKKESKLLNDEPIDVLIKYIDLSDKTLNRTGINQIKKDEDNQELRYSVRSILKNIPWIRKIYILMPNERVKFFRPPEDIQERIIYVKDKDLLGFDSASIYAFHYNLYKMKKFGLSENFILMDDDYFIAYPLKKEDFFYEDNGVILPALVTSDYYEMNKEGLDYKLKINLYAKGHGDAHSDTGFYIQQTRALLFMYEIFGNDDIRYGKKLIEPAFTHNAIPVKISDIEEIHDYILNKYEFGNQILTSLIRTTLDLQMHTAYMAYVKNKYDRKVSKISSSFFDLGQIKELKSNKNKLFVINVSNKIYKNWHFKHEKKILEELFPQKTRYELDIEDEDENQNDEEVINKMIHNLQNISLIEINTTKKNNKRNSLERLENLEEDISKLSEEIDKKITTYENIGNNDIYYEKILNEEIDYIEEQFLWQNKINNLLLIIILLLMIIIIYKIHMFRKYDL